MGPDTAISLSTATTNTGKRIITYHVADIRISDIRDLRTAFAHDTFGVGITEPMLDMAARHDALLAMNGDFYCYQNGGMVVHNGILFRNEPSDAEVCAILANGEMRIINAGLDAKTLSLMAVWQAWTFGPSLLDGDGHAKRHFSTKKYIAVKNPRSAIGFFCPGHYCFVVCDGRRHGYSDGASLTELASIMEGLGCKVAYNMDGGSSSMLIFDNSVYNIPSDKGRDIGDCIFIRRSKQ